MSYLPGANTFTSNENMNIGATFNMITKTLYVLVGMLMDFPFKVSDTASLATLSAVFFKKPGTRSISFCTPLDEWNSVYVKPGHTAVDVMPCLL